MNLEKNPALYAGLIHVIKRGTAEIIEETENGIFLRDTVSEGFMLAAENIETGKEWIKKHSDMNYTLFVVFQKELVDFVKQEYGFTEVLECYQVIYPHKTAPECSKELQIRTAAIHELQTVMKYYKTLSEEELRKVIERKKLFLAFQNEEMVGFIGEHLEGSMGLLEILPEYRRRGYGEQLELFMINNMLEQGFVPFGQVVVDNDKSLALQRKLGMEITKEKVYWVF